MWPPFLLFCLKKFKALIEDYTGNCKNTSVIVEYGKPELYKKSTFPNVTAVSPFLSKEMLWRLPVTVKNTSVIVEYK